MSAVTTTGANDAVRPESGGDGDDGYAHVDADTGGGVAVLIDETETDVANEGPSLRDRLVPPMPTDRVAAWLWALGVSAVAAVLRFWNLGNPPQIVFDETYYAKDAYSLLRFGYERSVVSVADGETPIDAQMLAGRTDIFGTDPSYVVHPPIGKWVIALGEWLFGLTPFGWRFGVATVGTLSVLILTFLARRLFRSTLLGAIAGLLLALDGLSIVMSRTALLDGVLAFWLVAAFACLLKDRDVGRLRLIERYEAAKAAGLLTPGGPQIGMRWWRLAAGICFGLACATKWSGLFVLAACGLMVLVWDVAARKALGVGRPYSAGIVYDGIPAFASMVIGAVVTYLVSWTGWFLADNSHDRQWAADKGNPIFSLNGSIKWQLPDWLSWLAPDALRSLLHYHSAALGFHNSLNLEDNPHPYAATAWRWLYLGRPTQFEFSDYSANTSPLPSGVSGTPEATCGASRCARDVVALGTPAIWWAGCLALAVLLVLWLGKRDWRAAAILVLVGSTWLPWIRWSDRPIFFFYSVAIAPFLVLAVTLVLGYLLGPPGSDARRRTWGAAIVGAYLLLVVIDTGYLYPVLSGQWIPYDAYSARMWFRTWI